MFIMDLYQTNFPTCQNQTESTFNLHRVSFDYLYEVIMMAYELDVPEQKGWDMQTYDNMVDNVTNGTSTYLTSDVKGILHRPVD